MSRRREDKWQTRPGPAEGPGVARGFGSCSGGSGPCPSRPPAGRDVSPRNSPFPLAQAFAGGCAPVPGSKGVSTPESRAQAGYFRARRLGGGAGAAGSARMASPLPACSGALPSPAQCAQLFGGERKCTRQPVMRGGPFIPRLVPRRERERSLEIPWDSIRSRVGIALYESPVSELRGSYLLQLHTAPFPREGSPPDITPGCPWIVANLPPASSRFSLPAKISSDTPTALCPRPCSGPKALFAHRSVCSAPGGGFEAQGRGWGRRGQGRYHSPPGRAPRPPLTHTFPTRPHNCVLTVGTVSFGKD